MEITGELGRELRKAVGTVRNSTGVGDLLTFPTETDMEVAR